MRILHCYCLNYNWGDYALGIGTKRLLREYLPVDFIAETNLQGTVFDEYYIDEVVNKKYDLLVIGGGGIIHGAHWPNGWFWLIREELIERIHIPFLVYGAGYNYFADEEGIPARGVSHLRKTIAASAFFSVRNDRSRERLFLKTGLNVPEVPDPGFFVTGMEQSSVTRLPPYVILQVANDKSLHRFSNEYEKAKFISQIRRIAETLSKEHQVIIAPHVFEDVSLSRDIAAGLKNVSVWDFSSFAFDRCGEMLHYYRDADLVLAMRGHAQIVPIGFKTPVISISNHPKHEGLMNELGLQNYNVRLGSPDFEPRVLELCQEILANPTSYHLQLDEISSRLRRQTDSGFQEIKRKLGITQDS